MLKNKLYHFLIIVFMFSVSQNIFAQKQKKYKVLKISQQSEPIHVSADKLWEIVGTGFEDAGKWCTVVDHSVGLGKSEFDGATCKNRACDLNAKGFSKIDEVITLYEEDKKEIAYDVVEGTPGFVKKYNSHWKVIDLGNGKSAVQINNTIEAKKFMGSLMGGMMKKNVNKALPTIFRDLKVYAETGEISEEKKERLAKLEAKK